MFSPIPCFPKLENHCLTINDRVEAIVGGLELLAGRLQSPKERIDQKDRPVAVCRADSGAQDARSADPQETLVVWFG